MRTPIRTYLLTGLLFLGLATGAQAQDKYEFASVTQLDWSSLMISIEGKPLVEQRLIVKEVKSPYNLTKLFEQVSKMQEEGWEVYHVMNPDAVKTTFVLRRKKA